MEEISGSHLVHPKKDQVQSQTRLLICHVIMSRWLLNIPEDWYSTESCRDWSYSAVMWTRAERWQLSPMISAVFLLCTASHFLSLLDSVPLKLASFHASQSCCLFPISSCPGNIPPPCRHTFPEPHCLGTMALFILDWTLRRTNELPLTAVSSLIEENRI